MDDDTLDNRPVAASAGLAPDAPYAVPGSRSRIKGSLNSHPDMAPLYVNGRGLVAFEGVPAFVAVKVVRAVGRSILMAPARRRAGRVVEAASGF
jgi:hypothetical protein